MSKDFKNMARRIKRANSKEALEIAGRIAEKLCCFGSVSDRQLDKLTELTSVKLEALQRANPGSLELQ